MSVLKGSETEKNLLAAFAGESQARNRYTYFAAKAEEEGYQQIAFIFARTADQEREHAKRLFGFLEGGDVKITGIFPAGVIGSTEQNLRAAAAGENYEHSQMYPQFAEIAKKEGFTKISAVFRAIAIAERQHEKQYNDLAANLNQNRVFSREERVVWYCRKCGYIHTGPRPPKECPACAQPQGYFELLAQNW